MLFCPHCAAEVTADHLMCVDPDVYECPGCGEDIEPLDHYPVFEPDPPPPEPEPEISPIDRLRAFRRRFPHKPGLELAVGTCSSYAYPKPGVGIVVKIYPRSPLPGSGVQEHFLADLSREDMLFFLRYPSLPALSIEEAEGYLLRDGHADSQ